MNTIENSLNKIAEKILCLDEASLVSLWEKYKEKAEQFSFTPEWEKAVIIFSLINAVRVKNAIFNEQLLIKQTSDELFNSEKPPTKPHLKLIK